MRILAALDSTLQYGAVKSLRETFGFIQSDLGGELYFNKGCMLMKEEWSAVTEGASVEYVMGENEKGEIADSVRLTQD